SEIRTQTDVLIHLAQSAHFRDFPGKAVDVFQVNTVSTLKLIDWALKNQVKQFIYASSGGVYTPGQGPVPESQDIVYQSKKGFYIATKHCSEVLLDNYASLLPVIQLRFFFIYGKQQQKNMLIPRLVNNVKNKIPITLDGYSGMKINPVHVDDAAQAISACFGLKESEKFNIGGPEILSIRDISETIGNLLGVPPEFMINDKPAENLIGDIQKMCTSLWVPKVRFKEGVQELIP
ncbi:MAG TPA: NAD(P)-dependent oxidoreductase, partial [Saprospiraceae bacterium]|nr:NAD(P)-dependent oxidoreductase [Saprospiraceae bacterium]